MTVNHQSAKTCLLPDEYIFTDPYVRKLHDDWDSFAYCILTGLRGEKKIVSTPIKARLAELTHAFRHANKEFNKWWSTHNILLPQPKFRMLMHNESWEVDFPSHGPSGFSSTSSEAIDTEDRLASMFP